MLGALWRNGVQGMSGNPIRYEAVATGDAGYLCVTAHGDFAIGGILRMIEAIAADSERQGCHKILIDVTALTGYPSTVEQFEIARATAERLQRKRVAVLVSTPTTVREGFGDTVAINRGGVVQSFNVESEALAWLLSA